MDHLRTRPSARRAAVTALALALIAGSAACGDGDDDDAGGADASPTTSPTVEPAPAPAPTPACEDTDQAGRRVVLCTAGEAPDQGLVVALHGRGSSADEMRAVTELERHAAGEGLAVAYPEALDGGWGDDTFTTPQRPAGDEDVRFLDDLVAALRADPRIGDAPIGVVGFSNGASMGLRYATQRPGDVRAVVAVAGQLPRDPAVRPTAAVPLLEVYGTADPVRPYDTGIPAGPARQPGQPTPTLSAPDTVAAFVAALPAAVPEEPEESDPSPDDGTRVRTERWAGEGGAVVVFRTIVDGGHTWPSARARLAGGDGYGRVSQDVDASADAVDFVVDPAAVG